MCRAAPSTPRSGSGASGIFDEIKSSRLRGRGGAGFPTPTKIEGARNAAGKEKYVVCNADEGEPGTFKDRVLLTSFLPRVLEGMAITGFAAGATKGFVYLRGEYQYLRPHVQRTIDEMRAGGLLGVSIRGAPGFDFDIQIHMGAGAYICGEGTAQINSLEGKVGRPRVKPPSMVIRGYKGMPTIVDNVETLAHLTEIALEGGASFARRGTRASTGTKMLSVSGDCARPGIYEYEFGVTIRQVLARLRRGCADCGAGGRRLGRLDHARRIQPQNRLRGCFDGGRLHDLRSGARPVRCGAQLRPFLRA